MRKWKWLLVITGVTILVSWYFLFYKTYSKQTIPASADMVVAIDLKKNINSLLYYYITTPSEWRLGSVFKRSKKSGLAKWKDAVKIPDYAFIFHTKGQPVLAWYCRLAVKNEGAYQQVMKDYDFKVRLEENDQSEYYCDKLGVDIIKKGDQLLVGNLAVKDKLLMRSVATELFNRQQFVAGNILEKITSPSNHFTLYVQKNNFLKEDALFNGHFTNGQLQVEGLAQTHPQFLLTESRFDIPDSSLINLVFTQQPPELYHLLPGLLKTKISTALNFNIDSILLPQNKKYIVDIAAIKTRTDSAVSYTYDDDFNKIENVVVNKIQEPALNCIVVGDTPSQVLGYWVRNKNIEVNEAGNLFTPIPFVKTYATVTKDSLLLTSTNYDTVKTFKHINCIGSLGIYTKRLPSNAAAYLPDNFILLIKNITSLNVTAKKENGSLKIELLISASNKKKPFLLSFD